VLGEHGFIGLALYLLMGVCTWRACAWIIDHTSAAAQLHWARSLATMVQTSMVGFAVGGAFLSLVYFDMPYYLMAAVIATRVLVERELNSPRLGRA
jgi:putative inorganic carbon (hco3(-)) transporter